MTTFMIDIEADGPIPGDYSMVVFGAVIVEESLSRTFLGKCAPISEKWIPQALAVSGYTRDECLAFPDPAKTMTDFKNWVQANTRHGDRPMFYSDNNGFDWQFVNYYFHHFLGENPFGHSSTNLGSLYKGMLKDMKPNFKHLRQTRHTHDPVDDAKGTFAYAGPNGASHPFVTLHSAVKSRVNVVP